MSGTTLENLKRFYPKNRREWRLWLEQNHETSPGVWLIYYKKHSKKPKVEYEDAVEEALAVGWIDSKVNALDEARYIQLFTPRKKNSTWSRLNKERIDKLINNGLMTPAGIEKVEMAKKDGSWAVMDDIEDLIVPDDLKKEMSLHKIAENNYNNFSTSTKKQILWWIKSAKRSKTRNDRIKKTVELAASNKSP